jgi:hypothetical protein
MSSGRAAQGSHRRAEPSCAPRPSPSERLFPYPWAIGRHAGLIWTPSDLARPGVNCFGHATSPHGHGWTVVAPRAALLLREPARHRWRVLRCPRRSALRQGSTGRGPRMAQRPRAGTVREATGGI